MANVEICWLAIRSSGSRLVRTCRCANLLACFGAVAWPTYRSKLVALALVRTGESHHKCTLRCGSRTGLFAVGAVPILAIARVVTALASARQGIAHLGVAHAS